MGLGATRTVTDVMAQVLVIGNPGVRQYPGEPNFRLRYLGNYGLYWSNPGPGPWQGRYLVSFHNVEWQSQDFNEAANTLCDGFFWNIREGCEMTFAITYL